MRDAKTRLSVAKAVSDAATHPADSRHTEAAQMTVKVARQAIAAMDKALNPKK